MQAGPGPADVACNERQRDQAAGIVRAVHRLRDAHTPEDDRVFRLGIKARHLTNRIRIDAADLRHFPGRERLHAPGKRLEALSVRLQVIPVVQFFFDNRVDHRVQQSHVRARLELQVVCRVATQPLAARIGDDEFRALLCPVFKVGRRDGMILLGARADDDDAVGVVRRGERRGHGTRADALHQRRHR